jgi:rare lipoprotein A
MSEKNLFFKIYGLLFILIILSSLYACSTAPKKDSFRGTRSVTASYYGLKFNGRPTASGEIFDMYAMTCAHKKMPFGTKLRVTNPDNNKSVIVTVNDRGPFIRGRDLDLSFGAARKIGFVAKGVGRVRIEHVGRDMHYVKGVPSSSNNVSGILSIQVGSFTEKANAVRLKDGLRLNYRDTFIDTALINGRKYHRVRVGKFKNHDTAYSLAKKLAREGYSILITSR